MRVRTPIVTAAAAGIVLIACSESTPPPTPESVAFATHAVSVVADDALPLAATVTMSDGSIGAQSLITYSSSAADVASVDGKGVVTAVAAGSTTISAHVGSLHDEVTVTVSWAPITTVTFGRDTATLLLDDSLSTSVVVTNSHNKAAPNAVVAYSSSNTDVATVDGTGRIRTFATGTATITGTVETQHSDIGITVVPHFTQIATGATNTCGITGTRRLYCWGMNINANLGIGSFASPNCNPNPCFIPLPTPVMGAERFVSVTAGEFHTCALTSGGAAYCWGGNYYGQLGIGTTTDRVPVPTGVIGGHTFTSISATRMGTCGIDTSGDTWCWGWDSWGQLGAGSTAPDRCSFFSSNEPCSGTPLKVVGNIRFAEVMGSEKTSCGGDLSGAVYCWGNEVGGTEQPDCQAGEVARCTRTPLLQVGGTTFTKLGMGGVYRCGQKSDAVLWCWGYDYNGTFGNGTPYTNTADTLVRVAGGRPWSQIAVGITHICGLNAGVVECWGYNHDGQAGRNLGVDQYTPGPINGGITFALVTSAPNSYTSCGVSTAGRAYCWGYGTGGNLGNGAVESSADPVLVKLVR